MQQINIYFGGPKAKQIIEEGLTIGGEPIRRVEGTKFLGVWVDEALKWTAHIGNVKTKVNQLVGVIGRTKSVLGRTSLSSLYNGLVLPHLQYCLIVWGDFEGCKNSTIGKNLLASQKKFARMIAGKKGRTHSDPAFFDISMLKIGDLYRQQLRVHAWHFWNGLLPENQTKFFVRTSEVHSYSTRRAESGMALSSRDQVSIAYRVPKEWSLLPEGFRKVKSLAAFKRQSKAQLLRAYGDFRCGERGLR